MKLRRKLFNLSDGYYTGAKNDVPGYLSCIAKGGAGGAVVGAGAGAIYGGIKKDRSAKDDAITGAKYGLGAGLLAGFGYKLFLNHMHNPMKDIKFQEIDRGIRKEFGVYNIQGISVGDSVDKEAKIEDKFSFNDSKISNYKINLCVQEDKITLYTFALSDLELEKVDAVLNHYCRKYHGMNYTSTAINPKVNSYSANITFTNYDAIVHFILDISMKLETKINLIDNKGLVKGSEKAGKELKFFSNFGGNLNANDALDILNSGFNSHDAFDFFKSGFRNKEAAGLLAIKMLTSAIKKAHQKDLVLAGKPGPRTAFGNEYLEQTLKRLHYVEGVHYTKGDDSNNNNISLNKGVLVIIVERGDDSSTLDKEFWKRLQTKLTRAELVKDNLVTYTYFMQSRMELDTILNTLFKAKVKFNMVD